VLDFVLLKQENGPRGRRLQTWTETRGGKSYRTISLYLFKKELVVSYQIRMEGVNDNDIAGFNTG
jgi:hypothetical protein